MTYGHGDSSGGWRPPSEPDPPNRGRRRAPEPAGEDAGAGRVVEPDRPFQAPPVPPVFEAPTYGSPPARGFQGSSGPGPDDRFTPRRGSPPGVYSSGSRGGAAPEPPPPPHYPPGGPHLPPDNSPRGYQSSGRAQVPPQQRAPSGRASVPGAGTGFGGGRIPVQSPLPQAEPWAGPRGRDGARGHDRLAKPLWTSVLAGVVVFALLLVAGVGGFYVLRSHAKPAPVPMHDISSQQVDPAPLTAAEVFPAAALTPDPAGPAYPVVKSEESADCATATVGDLRTLLAAQGCTQLVRATLISPDKAYVITAGILNLRDEAAADAVDSGIKASLAAQKGRFTGLVAGAGTEVMTKVATQLGWDIQGHFLAYCVVARSDGKPVEAGDPAATKVINDLVEVTLKGTVIADRIVPPTASTRPGVKASTAPSGK